MDEDIGVAALSESVQPCGEGGAAGGRCLSMAAPNPAGIRLSCHGFQAATTHRFSAPCNSVLSLQFQYSFTLNFLPDPSPFRKFSPSVGQYRERMVLQNMCQVQDKGTENSSNKKTMVSTFSGNCRWDPKG